MKENIYNEEEKKGDEKKELWLVRQTQLSFPYDIKIHKKLYWKATTNYTNLGEERISWIVNGEWV